MADHFLSSNVNMAVVNVSCAIIAVLGFSTNIALFFKIYSSVYEEEWSGIKVPQNLYIIWDGFL